MPLAELTHLSNACGAHTAKESNACGSTRRARPPCTAHSCLRAMFTLAFVLTNTYDPRLLSSLSFTDTHTPVKHTRPQVLSDDDEWSRCDALRRIVHGRRRQRVVEAHSRVRSAAVHSFSFYLFPVLATPRPSSSSFLLVLFIPCIGHILVDAHLCVRSAAVLFSVHVFDHQI
jgi:hypothetical protein